MPFPSEMFHDLAYYVYRLIDPRDGSTFYVGRGQGNRVFDHLRQSLAFDGDEDSESAKIRTIRQIAQVGLQPIHVIHRHGMNESEARLAEAVLIDAYPGLTNELGGEGSTDVGPAHANQLIERYQAEVMEIDPAHKILTINVRRSAEDAGLYDGTRCCWRVNLDRAQRADYIFAVTDGICREVFIADRWLPATVKNFPGLLQEDVPTRLGFIGQKASEEIRNRYVSKRLPETLQRRKGMASPLLYSYS